MNIAPPSEYNMIRAATINISGDMSDKSGGKANLQNPNSLCPTTCNLAFSWKDTSVAGHYLILPYLAIVNGF
ncbi:hypothetical protein SE17_29620 [Kouleothrix aurantiaca]|uniref:Uncharacterized protein n=1 Tax=Kouleothrix aurantiaca TaxID=186479 RepID=A0A0P9FBL1_9CHLR|nr:hypothetical protein SE17_29620 [Kouleothrix aurantiaca]